MQKSALARLCTDSHSAVLEKAWQIFKHDAEYRGLRPQVRFSSELLPAYYHSEVNSIQIIPDGGYFVKSSLSALSGNQAVIPRAMSRAVLNAHFVLGDNAVVDFFDCFNNRYYRLYCQSQQKNDLSAQIEEETFSWNEYQTSITDRLINLSGVVNPFPPIARQNIIQYTGLLGLNISCPLALKALLEDYFQTDFEIERSELEYISVAHCALTLLGRLNCRLGEDILLGKSTPMEGQKLKVKICPRDYRQFLNIQKDRRMSRAIDYMVRIYMGINGKYRLLIKVNSQYLPGARLEKRTLHSQNSQKLGLTTWIPGRAESSQFVEIPMILN